MKDEDLFSELKGRFKEDEKLVRSNKEKYEEICKENTKWLKQIISKYGWPSKEKVGENGEKYAWVIAQHSDDLKFQRKCSRLLKELPQTDERKKYIAYLTDRVLVREGKRQVYGTQFTDGKPDPIKDRDNLEERREKMNLESFEKCKRIMKQK